MEAIGRPLEFDAGPEYARGQSDLQDPMAGILISIPVGQQLAIEASGGDAIKWRTRSAGGSGRWASLRGGNRWGWPLKVVGPLERASRMGWRWKRGGSRGCHHAALRTTTVADQLNPGNGFLSLKTLSVSPDDSTARNLRVSGLWSLFHRHSWNSSGAVFRR